MPGSKLNPDTPPWLEVANLAAIKLPTKTIMPLDPHPVKRHDPTLRQNDCAAEDPFRLTTQSLKSNATGLRGWANNPDLQRNPKSSLQLCYWRKPGLRIIQILKSYPQTPTTRTGTHYPLMGYPQLEQVHTIPLWDIPCTHNIYTPNPYKTLYRQ